MFIKSKPKSGLFSDSPSDSNTSGGGLFGSPGNGPSRGGGLFGDLDNGSSSGGGLFGNQSSGPSPNQNSKPCGLFTGSTLGAGSLFASSQGPSSGGLFGGQLIDKVLPNIECPSGHSLTQTYHLAKKSLKYHNNRYGCDLCGGTFESLRYPSANCVECIFDLCPSCLKKYQPSQFKCDAGHQLSKIKHHGGLFANPQNYPCHSCKEDFPSAKEILMSCQDCNFHLCPPCFSDRTTTKPEKQVETRVEPTTAQESQCSGCKEARKTHLLLPCGHVCACNKCSADLVKEEGECPECQTQVEKRIKVFN